MFESLVWGGILYGVSAIYIYLFPVWGLLIKVRKDKEKFLQKESYKALLLSTTLILPVSAILTLTFSIIADMLITIGLLFVFTLFACVGLSRIRNQEIVAIKEKQYLNISKSFPQISATLKNKKIEFWLFRIPWVNLFVSIGFLAVAILLQLIFLN